MPFRPALGPLLRTLPIVLLLVPSSVLEGQSRDRQGTRFETELGASLFFGNTEQLTLSHRGALSRADSTAELSLNWDVTYGEATTEDGDVFVNRRNWTVGSGLDFMPHGRLSPFLFGTLEYSLQRKIDQRFSGGAGGKLTFIRTERSLFDLSGAALAERTVPREQLASETEWLARWSVRMRVRRSFDDGRISFSSENFYVPAFRDPADFTFRSTNSLSLSLSTRISLRLSFVDAYDSGATERGARTNNDGQVIVSLVSRF